MLARHSQVAQVQLDPHVVDVARRIGVLLIAQDVEPALKKEIAHRGDKPLLVGALDQEDDRWSFKHAASFYGKMAMDIMIADMNRKRLINGF